MVQKTYSTRPIKKPFYVPMSALALAFLLAFSPLQIFAQEMPVSKDVPSEGSGKIETERPAGEKPTGDVLGTSSESNDTKPSDDSKEDGSTSSGSRPDPIKDSPVLDEGGVIPEDEHDNSEEQEDESRDSGAPQAPLQTQVVPEKVKREKSVNLKDGSLSYQYQLALPQGRNGLSPEVSLSYNSNDKRNSIVATGWSLDIPYIERMNKTGSERIYLDDNFYSSVTGELVLESGTQFISKVDDGSFISYEYDNDYWVAYDKSGSRYTFGAEAGSRQDDPNDSARIYKWMISEIRDTNDNYIKYEYYKDDGQIYPSVITYTGNGSTDGIFEVFFDREAVPSPTVQFSSGFSVSTEERISEIRTEVQGDWVRKYEMAYSAGDNGEENLLDTIIESGIDENNNTVELSPIDFDYTESTNGWTYDSDWNPPLAYIDGGDYGMRMADIDGDALLDIVCYRDETNGLCNDSNAPPIYINNGDGFDTGSGWSVPKFVDDQGKDLGVSLMDVNGDGLNDVLRAIGNTYNEVYLNDGTNWVLDTSWVIPIPIVDGGNDDFGMRMADVNADGLPDILCHNQENGGYCGEDYPLIYINNGSGWDLSSVFQFPARVEEPSRQEAFLNANLEDNALHITDINGDGLADFIRGEDTDMYVYINTGSGWEYDTAWFQNVPFTDGGYDLGMRLEDINADGLTDIICQNNHVNGYCDSGNVTPVFLNSGYGWNPVSWSMPTIVGGQGGEYFTDYDYADNGLRMVDLNGDGVVDMVRGENSDNFAHISNSTTKSDLLSKITYPEGGTTEISYKGTPQFVDSNGDLLNPNLPMVNIVVSDTEDDDNNGTVSTRDYEYAGGEYYFNGILDRKFAGFNVVSETDGVGNVAKTYFHQGNGDDSGSEEIADDVSKIGKSYRTERYDEADNLYDLSVNFWENTAIGTTDADLVTLAGITNLQYDGDNDHKDTAVEYAYDTANGNLEQKISWGEVTGSVDGTFTDTGSDKKTENYTYAVPLSGSAINKVSEYETLDQSSTVVNKTRYYYDEESLGDVTLGNLTKEESLIDSSTYAEKIYEYDGTFGLVTSSFDANGNETQYAYDTARLYPVVVTNTLLHDTEYDYDYSSGKPVNITDPNGNQTEYVYDGFDRILSEKKSDPSNAGTLVAKDEYVYVDTSGDISVTKTMHLDGSLSHDEITYFDGLGRIIQQRSEAEGSGLYNVKDTKYNTNGHIAMESLPYEDSGSANTVATTDADLQILYTYDALGRVKTISNTIGDTTYAYDQWKTTETNQNNVPKDLYHDAYGRLVRVDERNDSSTYTTEYVWDHNGKLTALEDDLHNVRTFTYDKLGRRTEVTDLHASTDTVYGEWKYTYDLAGNLIEATDPNGDITTYVYDALNRVRQEDSDLTVDSPDVRYTYDSCTNGVGKLCNASNAQSVSTSYSYHDDGTLSGESRSIASNSYDTSYQYDRQGHLIHIQFADRSVVDYEYNKGNKIESINETEDGQSPVDIVTDADYSPHGLPSVLEYGNGITTTNTYDETAMYRLQNIHTTDNTTDFQRISYTYDDMGNILTLEDTSDTNAAKEVTYTYDDLNRLISAGAINTANNQDYNLDYSYNSIGNILTSPAGTYSYTGYGSSYANPHAMTALDSTGFQYDQNGNNTKDDILTNTFTYRNELSTSTDGASTLSFIYDHTGDRMTDSDGVIINYYPNKNYHELDTTPTKNIYMDDILVGTVDGSGGSAGYYYNHTDHLTGSSVTTNGSGQLEQTLDYMPFGSIRLNDQVSTFDQHHKFANSINDITGLNYMGARYQDPRLGRFISQDPVFRDLGADLSEYGTDTERHLSNPQMLNSYSYAINNPLKHTDRSGEIIDTIADIGFIAYDVYKIGQAVARGESAGEHVKALGLDAGGALIPGVTGLGMAGRLVNKADDVVDVAKNLPANTMVCRGGTCNADNFLKGSNEYKNGLNPSLSDPLTGISVNVGGNLDNLLQSGPLPNYGQFGQTILSDIQKSGGNLILDSNNKINPYHANLNGLNAKQLEKLFKPTKQNLYKSR